MSGQSAMLCCPTSGRQAAAGIELTLGARPRGTPTNTAGRLECAVRPSASVAYWAASLSSRVGSRDVGHFQLYAVRIRKEHREVAVAVARLVAVVGRRIEHLGADLEQRLVNALNDFTVLRVKSEMVRARFVPIVLPVSALRPRRPDFHIEARRWSTRCPTSLYRDWNLATRAWESPSADSRVPQRRPASAACRAAGVPMQAAGLGTTAIGCRSAIQLRQVPPGVQPFVLD